MSSSSVSEENTNTPLKEAMEKENKNPRDGASALSIMFLWWMNDVLRLGNKRPLTEKDLFPIPEDYEAEVLVEKAEQCWFDELKMSQSKNMTPRLWKAMLRLIPWKSRFVMIILRTLWSLSFAFLPLCVWLVLKTINDGPNMDMKFAFVFVALLGLLTTIRAASTQHYDYFTELWGLKLKVALIGLVYKKVLSLNRYSLEATLSGNTINLVSNDAQKIEKSLQQLGYALSAPLELITSLVILWYLIGWQALVGAALFFILVAFQMLMARKAAKLREKAAAFTDERLVVMNEIISGIRAVKMYAWEWNFRDIVFDLRRKEMAIIRLKGVLVSMLVVLCYTTIPIAVLISITTLAMTGSGLSSFEVFTVLLGLVTLRQTFCYSLGISIHTVADGKVALDRIQTFLEDKVSTFEGTEEHNTQSQLPKEQVNLIRNPGVQCKGTKTRKMAVQMNNYRPRVYSFEAPPDAFMDQKTPGLIDSHQSSGLTSEPYLSISDASCSWNQDYLTNTLNDITLNASNGDMLAITGEVGSGKSSLLTAILGELPLNKGLISFHGKVAYVPQIPWVFSGTVRENILFGLPFNEKKFQHVVHVCGLTKDMTAFTNGDLTEIGQRGATLSGGQKARVGLARAVYSDADIYLLDDPLSAVDTKVGKTLFESCILGHLSGRIRLLVTHQLQYLKDVDRIAVMEKGSIIHQGRYKELTDQGVFSDILELSQFSEDKPGRVRRASLYEFNEKGNIIKVANRPRSITSVSFMKDHTERKHKDNSLYDPVLPILHEDSIMSSPSLRDENISELPKRTRSVSLFAFNKKGSTRKVLYRSSASSGFSDLSENEHLESKIKESFADDGDIVFSPRVDLIAPKASDLSWRHRSVSLCEYNKWPTKKVLHRPSVSGSVSFLSGHESFEYDELPKLQEDEVMSQQSLDLKEDEESKMAGTVSWRLYWDYFKEGLPVPLIILLAVVLILAQGKIIQ
ncbi:hypothetical protein OS493_032967 [Desmophyllum pertusum]|uniref:Multidrug resistance-associated protein 4 n=1 Tax=Desmophyllum pertusum TaxID=174260 RepID=A0A9X0CEK8_9CNID|nr:hypothetical protein OS493_032967 [Desmophyllum pertusum]